MNKLLLQAAVALVGGALLFGCNKAEGGSSSGGKSFVQKGIKAGHVVVGYLQDASDPNQCAVVTDKAEKKDDFKKNAAELAKMMKAKVVDSCPTDSVVGTCDVGLGMLDNYSSPKWTADTAKKDCITKPHQTWVE